MDQYVGVSLKQTWISVRQNRKRIWRGKCLSHPRVVAEAIRQHAPNAVLVVFETLSTWFHHELTACQRCASTHGMRRRRSTRRRTRPTRPTPVVARRGRVLPGGKSWAAMPVLVGGRAQLIGISSDLSNQILMRTFGLVVPAGGGWIFESAPCSRDRRRWRGASCPCSRRGARCALKRRCSTGSSWRWRARARHVGC